MKIIEFFKKTEKDLTPIDIDLFSFIATTKCNLRCKGCDNFMDHYENPSTPAPNSLISDAEALLECVNSIKEFKIIGGEPFLNRELYYLLEYLFEGKYKDKISMVRIMTNGTVIPDKNTLNVLKKYNDRNYVYVTIYGDKSKKVLDKLDEYDIRYEKSDPSAEWRDSGNTDYRDRSVEELKDFYSRCFSKDMCNCMLNGEYHICPRSAHAKDLNYIPDYKNDYVNLRKGSVNSRINKLNILKKRDYIDCCNHCDLPLMKVVKRKNEMH